MGKKSREKKERREIGQDRKLTVKGREGKIERFLLWLIYGAVFFALFAPLVVSPKFYFPFVGPKSLYFMGLAQIAIFSWLSLQLVSKNYRPKSNPLFIALIVFFVILVLAALFGASPSNSFWSKFERMTGILMWFHLIGFFLVLISVFKKESDWQKIFIVSLFVSLIVSFLSLTHQGGSTKEGATIGNTSFMGTYLLLNIFWAVYLFFRPFGPSQKYISFAERKGWRLYAAFCFVVLAVALYFSTARAALFCFYGGFLLIILFYLAFKPQRRWLRNMGRVLLIGFFLLALIAVVSMVSPKSPVRTKFVQEATKSRLVVWEKAWKGFKERPVLGWGPENYELVFMKYFNPCMFLPECGSEIWFDRSHNIIFDTLVTSGVLGLLAYLAIFVSAFYLALKRYFKNKIDFWTLAVPPVILIAYFVQNLTVFDMISSYLMFFLIMGFIASRGEETEGTEETARGVEAKPMRRQWIFGILLVVLYLTFFRFIIQPARTGMYVIDALLAQTTEERLTFYQKAVDTSPLGRYQIREFFGQKSQNLLGGQAEQLPLLLVDQELDLVSSFLEDSRKEYPLDFRTVLRLAQIYGIHGFVRPEKLVLAEKVAREAVGLSPTNQQGYWSLAQSLLYQGKFVPAFSLVETAVQLEPRWFQSHEIALKIARMAGNEKLVEQLRARALEINPKWEKEINSLLESYNPQTS